MTSTATDVVRQRPAPVAGATLVARARRPAPRARFARIMTVLVPMFFLRVPALALLGAWFALQALEGMYGLAHPEGEFVGIAFFAHVGGFAAGVLLAMLMAPEAWPRSLLRPPGDEERAAPV
jgi:membrane associated rhomboid family serine protease